MVSFRRSSHHPEAGAGAGGSQPGRQSIPRCSSDTGERDKGGSQAVFDLLANQGHYPLGGSGNIPGNEYLDLDGLFFADLGTVPYAEALELQNILQLARRKESIPDVILLLEHPSVVTLGIHASENILRVDEHTLSAGGIGVERIRRGGGATGHEPGQLVMYPIVRLPSRGLRVVPYVRFLEESAIRLLSSYGVQAMRRQRFPGVWINEQRKIASIGVQINEQTTMHGIALNMINDLSIFQVMIPCGLHGVDMTSARIERPAAFSEFESPLAIMTEAKERMESICIELMKEYPLRKERA